MAEELQYLIDRIRKDGVENAEQEAEAILQRARTNAADLVTKAEKDAQRIVTEAKLEAEAFAAGSTRTLEQAARDLLITIGAGVESMLNDLVGESLEEALDASFLQDVLARLLEHYIEQSDSHPRIEVLASPADQQMLIDFFRSRYQSAVREGITVLEDHDVLKGFKISSSGDRVHHEFTDQAIADALSDFLRPHLSEIVHRVACPDSNQQEE